MNQDGLYKIRFSEQFEPDSLKLIELSPEMTEQMSNGLRSLTIRGKADDNVVVVSLDQTFKVNLLETSNTMLLLRPSLDPDNCQEVFAAPRHHYELIRTIPDMKPLLDLLHQNCIDSDHLEVFYSEPGAGRPSGVTMQEFQDIVQASDEEILKELVRRRAIEVQGFWFCLDKRLLTTVLSEIIDVVQALSLSMNRLSFMEIATELADAYPSLLVRHVLNCFKEKNGTETNNDDIIVLDEKLVSQEIATRIFLQHPKIPYEDFMEKWRLELPGRLRADESYLHGIAYLEETSFSKNLFYVPIEKLPLEPKARFDFLFGIRSKWPIEELVALIQDIVDRGHPLETIIMKHTKTIQKGEFYIAKKVPR